VKRKKALFPKTETGLLQKAGKSSAAGGWIVSVILEMSSFFTIFRGISNSPLHCLPGAT
jgi:hypothetical protein